MLRSLVPALCLLLGLVSASPEAAAQTARADLVRAVVGVAPGATVPGCAVGLFERGGRLFVDAGVAEIATGRRMTPDTLFYSGSLAKQFTALAIVRLSLTGKLRLDDDARKFLPELTGPRGRVTVAMLLHHTAGVPNTARLWPLAGYASPGQATQAETLRLLLAYPTTNFPPGATFEYSNGGYELLAEIVERVSGVRYEDYIETTLLRPMGMARSRILRGRLPDDPDMARGYVPTSDGFALSEDLPLFGGAGGLMLTINDLERYHHDITSGRRIWTPAVTRLMTQAAAYPDGSPVILPVPAHHFGYAAGLMLSRDWVLHGGNFAGFQALFAWRPGTPDAIALLCNRGDLHLPELATRILASVRPDLPAVNTERHQLPPLFGRFTSEEARAIYQLAPEGDDLRVEALSPSGVLRSERTLKRTGERAFAAGPLVLQFDPDNRGFVVGDETNHVRFHRSLGRDASRAVNPRPGQGHLPANGGRVWPQTR